jgi:hypothetical protein
MAQPSSWHSHLDTTAQGRTVDPRGTAVRVRQTQLGLLPQQPLSAPTVRAVRIDLDQWHHAAVDFRNHDRRPCLGRPRGFSAGIPDQRAGVPFGHLADRARRQDHTIVLLQFARRLRERQVRPQVRHHPLQRPRAAAVMHFGTLRKGTPPPRRVPILRFVYFDVAEGAVPAE